MQEAAVISWGVVFQPLLFVLYPGKVKFVE